MTFFITKAWANVISAPQGKKHNDFKKVYDISESIKLYFNCRNELVNATGPNVGATERTDQSIRFTFYPVATVCSFGKKYFHMRALKATF